ncbi:Alpha/beta hydrolase family protein [Paenibacillus sp. 1_12]|uniref:alpha/beta hydrolase family protein n=1 Tax=Paenibacillus sp. 1_12 TaxID=1566278 RepID=UPI0008E33A29|nr:prolyl oligopeptidase family serine peptidase [Paenibacillus sp. 1_12]SFM30435.1 Alpha/beta hydrolase family protein [Paenibacillus sp. 1_12]
MGIILSYKIKLLVVLITALCTITACKPEPLVSPKNSQSDIPSLSQEDGTIISKEWVQVTDQNPNINIYKIFYMSENTKVEAYLSEPKISGKYPMLVNLHGGYLGPRPIKNDLSDGFQAVTLKNASDKLVILETNYRGYMNSDGFVQGLAGNTLDTQNAIKAALSFGTVNPESIYLRGVSLGGAVALRTASERHDIKAVALVSPFVGWDVTINWMDEHPSTDQDRTVVVTNRGRAESWKKLFKADSKIEKENSLLDRISNIQAPVLLLQGTGDESLVWETVQEFSDKMKEANKNVKLILYPDGNHGLHDKYQKEYLRERDSWFAEYGLPLPFVALTNS